jgi:hypothetical protein
MRCEGVAMSQTAIFWPVIALVALTFAVGGLTLARRLGAAFAGKVGPKDFRYGESDRVPPEAVLPSRNLINLLEVPVLFYVVCLCLFVTQHVTPLEVGLAWAFVAGRIAHSIVHMTYNNVLHRMLIFNAANVVLIVLWVRFALFIM